MHDIDNAIEETESAAEVQDALVVAIRDPAYAQEQVKSFAAAREVTGGLSAIIQHVERHRGASLTPLYPERAIQVLRMQAELPESGQRYVIAVPDLRTEASSLSAVHYVQFSSPVERRELEPLLRNDRGFLYVHKPATFHYGPRQSAVSVGVGPLPFQWGMRACGFPGVWQELEQGADLGAIGVIDDGPVLQNADLLWNVTGSPPVEGVPSKGIHASGVASVIAATRDNRMGIDGCTSARVHIYNVYNSQGFHAKSMYLALKDAATRQLPVVNLSIWSNSPYDVTIPRQIQDCIANRVTVVAAMGNQGTERELYPAVYPNVIAVGATDHSDLRWKDASFGKHILLSAPGYQIDHISDYPTPIRGNGTSYSAPMVAAASYLIRRAKPEWSPAEVRCLLARSARKLPQGSHEVGRGCLDMVRIVAMIKCINQNSGNICTDC